MGANMCNSGEKYFNLINANRNQLNQIVLAQQAKQYIDKNFHTVENQANDDFNTHKNQGTDTVEEHKKAAKIKISELKQKVKQSLGGSLKPFEQVVQKKFDDYLIVDESLKQFDTFKDESKGQFITKKEFLLKSMNTQKDGYKRQIDRRTPKCAALESQTPQVQEEIKKFITSSMTKEIKQNNQQKLQTLKQRLAIPLLSNNLTNLDAVKKSDEFLGQKISKWTQQVSKVLGSPHINVSNVPGC